MVIVLNFTILGLVYILGINYKYFLYLSSFFILPSYKDQIRGEFYANLPFCAKEKTIQTLTVAWFYASNMLKLIHLNILPGYFKAKMPN